MNFDLYETPYKKQIRTDKYQYIAIDLEEKKVLLLEGGGFQYAEVVRELTGDDLDLPPFWQMYVNKVLKNIDNVERTPRGLHHRAKR